jgi:hypothetical protein
MKKYAAIFLCLFFAACVTTDATMLTKETFPPQGRAEILMSKPDKPYEQIAFVSVLADSNRSYSYCLNKLALKAGSLGADAVIPTTLDKVMQGGVVYQHIVWGIAIRYLKGSHRTTQEHTAG